MVGLVFNRLSWYFVVGLSSFAGREIASVPLKTGLFLCATCWIRSGKLPSDPGTALPTEGPVPLGNDHAGSTPRAKRYASASACRCTEVASSTFATCRNGTTQFAAATNDTEF